MDSIKRLEKISSVIENNKTLDTSFAYLLPINSYSVLLNLFFQFMGNKIQISRILIHRHIDLSSYNETIKKTFDIEYQKTRTLMTQYRRDIKGRLLSEFAHIISFCNSFNAYCSYLVEDINNLLQNADSQEYRGVPDLLLEYILRFKENTPKIALENLRSNLLAIYNEISKLVTQLLPEDSLKIVKDILKDLNTSVEAMDEQVLIGFSTNKDQNLALRKVSNGGDENQLLTGDNLSTILPCLNASNQELDNIGAVDFTVRALIEFNVLVEQWLNGIVQLIRVTDQLDNFWLTLESNIKKLVASIEENKTNEIGIKYILEQIENEERNFDILRELAMRLESKTIIELPDKISEDNFLELLFLCREVRQHNAYFV